MGLMPGGEVNYFNLSFLKIEMISIDKDGVNELNNRYNVDF